jgi:hypothetical protein
MENRNVNQFLPGGWYQWEGEDIRKGCRRVNAMEILSIFMYENGKSRPVETIPGMGEGSINENDGGDKFNYDML